MEITNMYNTLNGNECQKHLEKLIKNEAEGRIVIWGHKHKIDVEDSNTFHNIAQEMKVKNINNFCGGLHYIGEVEKELWTICLDDELNQAFLDKYGEEYQIN
ncbi:MAG: hypothetical protein ABIE36_00160 [Candidatus Diapherotrites archaeon]